MSDPAYVRAFKVYTRDDPTFTDLPAMEQEFYGESARAVVILQASMVEALLETAIQQKMRRDLSAEMKKDIFEFEGPVGSFSAKVTIAFALEIIGPKTKRDLDLIRLMRNQFAHCRKPLRFDMPEVAEVCIHLLLPEIPGVSLTPMALLRISRTQKIDLTNPKTRYVTCCHSLPLGAVVLMFSVRECSSTPGGLSGVGAGLEAMLQKQRLLHHSSG
jgi:hypothetical protein